MEVDETNCVEYADAVTFVKKDSDKRSCNGCFGVGYL